MKRDEKQQLRSKSVADLQEEIATLEAELLKGRFAQAVENTGQGTVARVQRRQIARLKTIIGEKTAAEAKA